MEYYVLFVCMLSCLWTVAHQAPLSMEFSKQECWRGLLSPPPGNLPDPGIEPATLASPALAGGLFTTSAMWETSLIAEHCNFNKLFWKVNIKLFNTNRNC